MPSNLSILRQVRSRAVRPPVAYLRNSVPRTALPCLALPPLAVLGSPAEREIMPNKRA